MAVSLYEALDYADSFVVAYTTGFKGQAFTDLIFWMPHSQWFDTERIYASEDDEVGRDVNFLYLEEDENGDHWLFDADQAIELNEHGEVTLGEFTEDGQPGRQFVMRFSMQRPLTMKELREHLVRKLITPTNS